MEYLNDKGQAVSPHYYEGVLQLRNPTHELIEFVKKAVESSPRAFIAKMEKSPNGVDMYISSQKWLLNIGKMLLKKFGGEMKVSRRIFTTKRLTSKNVYRVTVLFRFPDFKPGDKIRYKKGEMIVKNIGKKVFGIDVETGKKVSVDYKDIS